MANPHQTSQGLATDAQPLDDEGARQWMVVNTQPHRERFALENLDRQDFTSYCPMLQKTVRHARKARNVLRPMFPGYVFVEVDLEHQRWQSILSTYGVRSVVRCGDEPSFLTRDFIASLKVREVDGVIVRPQSRYTIGQKVRFSGGAFDNLIATIIDMDEKDRLVVLMDLLNSRVKVKVGEGSVFAV